MKKVDFWRFLTFCGPLCGLFRGSWRTTKGSTYLQGGPHVSQCSQYVSLVPFGNFLERSILGFSLTVIFGDFWPFVALFGGCLEGVGDQQRALRTSGDAPMCPNAVNMCPWYRFGIFRKGRFWGFHRGGGGCWVSVFTMRHRRVKFAPKPN